MFRLHLNLLLFIVDISFSAHVYCCRTIASEQMKALNFALVFYAVASVRADYHGSDMVMNILSQFLSTPSTETSTPASGILPKILNPMHWIPNFENIPWNPDSELTTVSCKYLNDYSFNQACFVHRLRLLFATDIWLKVIRLQQKTVTC